MTPGIGIEIDAQFVGMLEIAGRTGWGCSSMQPRLTIQASPARVIDHDLFRGPAGGK